MVLTLRGRIHLMAHGFNNWDKGTSFFTALWNFSVVYPPKAAIAVMRALCCAIASSGALLPGAEQKRTFSIEPWKFYLSLIKIPLRSLRDFFGMADGTVATGTGNFSLCFTAWCRSGSNVGAELTRFAWARFGS